MNDSSWRILYSFLGFPILMCSFVIPYFCHFNDFQFLADTFFGGILLSLAILDLFPMAHSMIDQVYPFTTAISLLIFALLSLFSFIRQSLQLADDDYLVQCDGSVAQGKIDDGDGVKFNSSKFSWYTFLKNGLTDRLPLLIFAIILIFDQIMLVILLSSASLSDLNYSSIMFIGIRFFTFLSSGYIFIDNSVRPLIYWIYAFIISLIFSIFMLFHIKLNENCINSLQIAYGISTSLLIGFFFFYGGQRLHSGLEENDNFSYVTIILLFVSFLVPTTFVFLHQSPIFIRHH